MHAEVELNEDEGIIIVTKKVGGNYENEYEVQVNRNGVVNIELSRLTEYGWFADDKEHVKDYEYITKSLQNIYDNYVHKLSQKARKERSEKHEG